MGVNRDSGLDDAPVHVRSYDPLETTASVAAIEALAAIEEIDPTELRPCLFEILDPDALNDVLAPPDGDVVVSFAFGTYRVLVDGRGEVRIFRAEV